MKVLVPLIFDPLLGQTKEEVAGSALSLLLDKQFEGTNGALFLRIKNFKRVDPGSRASDVAEGRRLWELCERIAANGTPRQGARIRI